MLARAKSAYLIFVVILMLVGCRDSGPEITASLTAVPNPVPAGEGQGSTAISWSISGGEEAAVYVSINEEEEVLFAGLSPSGQQDADWIDAGSTYEFRLYHDEKVIKTVTVTKKLE